MPALIPLHPEHIEEIIINLVGFDQQPNQEVIQNQEHVLAMDELTDTDSEGDFQPVALAMPPVEIVPFPDFNNLQPMIPAPEDEIQVEDLLRYVGNNIPALDSPQ